MTAFEDGIPGAAHLTCGERVYDAPGADDGARVLVDRLWPGASARTRPRVEFVRRYRAELAQDDHAEGLAKLHSLLTEGPVTRLTATKDLSLSQVTVLADEVG